MTSHERHGGEFVEGIFLMCGEREWHSASFLFLGPFIQQDLRPAGFDVASQRGAEVARAARS